MTDTKDTLEKKNGVEIGEIDYPYSELKYYKKGDGCLQDFCLIAFYTKGENIDTIAQALDVVGFDKHKILLIELLDSDLLDIGVAAEEFGFIYQPICYFFTDKVLHTGKGLILFNYVFMYSDERVFVSEESWNTVCQTVL